MVCRNMEKEGVCNNYNCLYLHPANYYRQDGGIQNTRNRNNNGVNYVNNGNNSNNINGYYKGYGGYEEWNRGNNKTDWNNRNNNGYKEYDDRNRWGHGYGREENFHIGRKYCKEWPSPWEGRIMRMMERRMDQRWDENRRTGWW